MKTKAPVLACLSVLLCLGTAEEVVVFGDNVRLTPVNESLLDTATATKVADPKNTGSRLFDTSVVGEDTRLSLNFPVKKFKSADSVYFRAHPAFMRCLQRTVNYVYQGTEHTVVLADTGFKTADDVTGSTNVDLYSRSGTGAALRFPDGITEDVITIAEGVLMHCPFIFGLEMRDIGVVIMSDRVFVYMAGADDKEPLFESQGYAGKTTAEFKTWCLDKIDESIDPVKTPPCQTQSGDTFPAGASSAEAVVGAMDEVVTRDSADFSRLVQFAGRNIVFEDTEHSSAWCGDSGNPCVDCSAGMIGQAPSNRCADRLMSPRLYRSIRVLQKLVRENDDTDRLKVIDAWDEVYDGHTTGDNGALSLHREGRAALLELTKGPGILLLKLAVCSQMDYVKKISATRVLVAVKKQANVDQTLVSFPEDVLLDVAPPADKADNYILPDIIVEEGKSADYPLFDGNVNIQLGISSKTDDFHASSSRYFRAHPAIVKCYDDIMSFEERWMKGPVKIKINMAFLTVAEQLNVETQRGDAHLLGQGLELSYDDNSLAAKFNAARLAKAAIDQCGPLFYEEGWNIGIGVDEGKVFVGMMEESSFWVNDASVLPEGVGLAQYIASLQERFHMAVHGYVVDPLNPEEACTKVPMQRQSVDFKHEHPEYINRRRKRQASDDCVPSSNAAFCGQTLNNRDKEIGLIWVEVQRLHLYHSKSELDTALKGCFGGCGNCVKGTIYEDKTEHCNNFLHWSPFSLMNDAPDVTNLFYKDNDDLRPHACAGHCLDHAPLFAQLAPSLERLYRPDEDKSIEEELYGVMDNPNPVYELLVRLYAMHAKGKVTVWVKNEIEAEYIRGALEVVFLHNKDVTNVEIFVSDTAALVAVDGAVESMIADWVKTGCPHYTRETITPFEVKEMSSDRKKRDIEEFDLGHQLRMKRKYFEQDWIRSSLIN